MAGWLKIHRSLLDNDLWTAEPFTYGQAWVDLLMSANYTDKSAFVRGVEIMVYRGQLAWSELSMSKRWKWSRGKVRRYLGMLEKRGMVVQQKSHVTTILTICNYSSFQDLDQQTEQQAVQQTEQQAVQQKDNRQYTTKEGNKGNKENKNMTEQKNGLGKPGYPDWFEDLWSRYPSRSGTNEKKKALTAVNARIKEGYSLEDLANAVGRYAKFIRSNGNENTPYVMQAVRFFGPGGNIDNPWTCSAPVTNQSDPAERPKPRLLRDIVLEQERQSHG